VFLVGRGPIVTVHEEDVLKQTIGVFLLCLAASGILLAQAGDPGEVRSVAQAGKARGQQAAESDIAPLDPQQEKCALQIFLTSVQKQIVSAAEAMPADKYGFAPTEGEFKGVRSFGQQVKHLAATNHILAAAALGEEAPADAGDETGPEAIRTKAEILDYLNSSFAHLGRAIDAIGARSIAVKSSPISPLPASAATRLALTVEALIHAFDHYGQMVEYLRMNGVVPPPSRP
jgi:uncharacterized damage-inducible protein DinB